MFTIRHAAWKEVKRSPTFVLRFDKQREETWNRDLGTWLLDLGTWKLDLGLGT